MTGVQTCALPILSIEFINKIIVFKKTTKPKELPKPKVRKEIDVTYNNENDFLAIKQIGRASCRERV